MKMFAVKNNLSGELAGKFDDHFMASDYVRFMIEAYGFIRGDFSIIPFNSWNA